MQRQPVSEWFIVSKKQRNGIFVMLSVIILCLLVQLLSSRIIQPVLYSHSEFEKEIAALKIKPADSANRYRKKLDDHEDAYQPYHQPYDNRYSNRDDWKGELFYFDPNTLDETGWKKLGLSDKTIATVKNYLSKGGRFYKPEDIRRIWGLKEELAGKLIPFIQIAGKGYTTTEKPAYEKKTYVPSLIDINMADTAALIALPGIGSKLAQRIIIFRDKLGGFYNIAQLAETYGLADSTFQKIKARLTLINSVVKKININTATLDELKAHPYIRYNVGNAIVQYRNQHGNFHSVTDLKKIVLVTPEVYDKMQPYLAVQ